MALDQNWFTEACDDCGTAFSLKIKGRLHEERSEYQKIEIYETETFGNLMVLDGFVMLTSRDNFLYHEMMTHPALFTVADPKRVVIIGGGDCGTLREVLRHPGVEEAWQVEIDERVTRVSEQYFPELCEANGDPRARFFFGDGVKWMQEQPAGSVDLVIVDSTDPIGPAEGLFAEPFYRDCLRAIRDGGVLVQQSESPLIHLDLLKRMRAGMVAAGFDGVKTLPFPQPVYPSGWWSATMAAKGCDLNRFREEAARAKPFETIYYNADLHRGVLAQPEFLLRELG